MIEWLAPRSYEEWDRFVHTRPFATCFLLSGWSRIARKVYGLDCGILASRANPTGAITGGLPLFHVRRPLHPYVTSGIFGSYGPLLCSSAEEQRCLIDAAIGYTRAKKARFLMLKTMDSPEARVFPRIEHEGLARHDVWVTAILPLESGPEVLWKSLSSSMRAKVRKAQGHGLEIRFSRDDRDLEAFYDVLSENMRRKGFPIYGMPFMAELLAEFGERTQIVTLWRGGESVSGAVVLEYRGVVYIPFVSSRPRFFPLRPNNLLYWEIMRHYSARGARVLDFGTSLVGASTLDFKTSWGATTHALPSYIFSAANERVQLDANSFGVRLGASIMKSLPPAISDRVGPRLAKFLV
jgi:FemAB-related protein (PEP-CTERM system-associated)